MFGRTVSDDDSIDNTLNPLAILPYDGNEQYIVAEARFHDLI